MAAWHGVFYKTSKPKTPWGGRGGVKLVKHRQNGAVVVAKPDTNENRCVTTPTATTNGVGGSVEGRGEVLL